MGPRRVAHVAAVGGAQLSDQGQAVDLVVLQRAAAGRAGEVDEQGVPLALILNLVGASSKAKWIVRGPDGRTTTSVGHSYRFGKHDGM